MSDYGNAQCSECNGYGSTMCKQCVLNLIRQEIEEDKKREALDEYRKRNEQEHQARG